MMRWRTKWDMGRHGHAGHGARHAKPLPRQPALHPPGFRTRPDGACRTAFSSTVRTRHGSYHVPACQRSHTLSRVAVSRRVVAGVAQRHTEHGGTGDPQCRYGLPLQCGHDVRLRGPQFYEAASVLLVFILLGHWLEMRARAGASAAIRALLDLAPPKATVLRDGRELEIPTADVVLGDIVVLRPETSCRSTAR